jgi:hypothetical protein
MSNSDSAHLRATQAGNAATLAELLREYDLPPIGWYITGTDGHVEGQLYREDAEAIRAELSEVADLLHAELTEGTQSQQEGGAWTRLAVEARYGSMPVTVYGYVAG